LFALRNSIDRELRKAGALRPAPKPKKSFIHPPHVSHTILADLIGGGVMDWKLAVKEERAALKRIVALLFALADLAESASRRSRIVRRFVIWVLRRAETVARDYVIGEDMPPAAMPVGPAGNGPADAMRLAENLRDLACELALQARLAFAVRDDTGQAELARIEPRKTLDTAGFPNAPRRSVFATIAGRNPRATGPPTPS
jgi:hypothetical protein